MTAQAVLVIGPSGSGKTYWSDCASKKFSKVFRLTSGETDVVDEFTICISKLDHTYDTKLANSLAVCDDLINPDPAELKAVRRLLLYTKRHHNVTVHLLLHSATRNNTW